MAANRFDGYQTELEQKLFAWSNLMQNSIALQGKQTNELISTLADWRKFTWFFGVTTTFRLSGRSSNNNTNNKNQSAHDTLQRCFVASNSCLVVRFGLCFFPCRCLFRVFYFFFFFALSLSSSCHRINYCRRTRITFCKRNVKCIPNIECDCTK